jgi:iron complex outermembrane receptor protein
MRVLENGSSAAFQSARNLSTGLLLTTSFLGLLTSQAIAQGSPLETVVVTGTSIRGAAPTGSNLITVDRAVIVDTGAKSVQELLTNVPQINVGFGSAGQAAEGGGGNVSAPTIHSLGQQDSNATLVLIDGHRIPPTGQTVSVVDPSIIPAAALQRVEVLPDGASSIYGADAIAGVLNFITRKDYSGIELSSTAGYASHYQALNLNGLIGHSWAGGSVFAAYTYSSRSNLANNTRDFITTRQDIRRGADANPADFIGLAAAPPAGSMTATPAADFGTTGPFGVAIPYPSTGSNLQNFACPIATIAANSTGLAFLYPYNGTGISTSQTTPSQGVCDTDDAGTALPSQTRNSGIVSFRQELTPQLLFSLELLWTASEATTRTSRGTVSATVFGPTGTGPAFGTGQRNPFFVGNATTGTSSEFIRYNFDDLLGPGAITQSDGFNQVAIIGFDYDIGGGWNATMSGSAGQSRSPVYTRGAVCAPCALEALNGTTNSAGTANTTAANSASVDPQNLGTVISATRVLTTANALDVWNPAATNRTSVLTLQSLVDSKTLSESTDTMQEFSLKADGPVVDLGTGLIKAALGVVYNHQGYLRATTADSPAGPASTLSSVRLANTQRKDNYAAFLEIQTPLIRPDDNVPLIESLNIDLSGRYDHFNQFGSTTNPKIGMDWTVVDGIRVHGSYGTSFQAPEVHEASTGTEKGSNNVSAGGVTNGLVVPFSTTIAYSKDPNLFEGSGIAGTWVSTAASCAAAGSNPVDANGNTVSATSPLAVACKVNSTNSPGLSLGGVVPDLGPEKGQSYSVGIDLEAGKVLPFAEGLTANVTYYQTKFVGLITSSGVTTNFPSSNAFAPIGGWAAGSGVIATLLQTADRIQSAVPAIVWTVSDGRTRNAYTLWQNGLDIAIHYRYVTDTIGTFTFGIDANQLLRFTQKSGNLPGLLDIINGRNNGRATGIEMTEVTSLGWQMAPFRARLAVQYAHPYWVTNNSFPYNLAGPNRLAGTQHIGALLNADLHLSYDLPEEWLSGVKLDMDIKNLTDSAPPFRDIASGAGGGSPIGREFQLGITKQF